MQSTHKKILETVGLYVASWVLVYLTFRMLNTQFVSIAASIIAVSTISCLLFIVLGVTSIIVKKVECRIRYKTKRASNDTKKTSNTTLRVVATYAVSLSLTANIFFPANSLHMIFDHMHLIFLRMSLISTAIMILLITAQIIFGSIQNKKRK